MDSTFSHISQLIGIAFICALLIERILQVLKALMRYVEAKSPRPDYWNMRAAVLTRRYLSIKKTSPELANFLARRYLFRSTDNQQIVVDANHVRQLAMRGRFKMLGVILGLVVAFALNLSLIDLIDQAQNGSITADGAASGGASPDPFSGIRDLVGQIMMGVGMGLGATPLHELMARLERAYKTARVMRIV